MLQFSPLHPTPLQSHSQFLNHHSSHHFYASTVRKRNHNLGSEAHSHQLNSMSTPPSDSTPPSVDSTNPLQPTPPTTQTTPNPQPPSNQTQKPPKHPKTPAQPRAPQPTMPPDPEKERLKAMYEDWNNRIREPQFEELIFDEEGLPYISHEELETTIRVLQLFNKYPQVAMAGTYGKDTYENFMFAQLRSLALRWLRPADAPAVKDILALIKVQEASMLQSTGIRNERNRKKKLLPHQCGQVYINHEVHEQLMFDQKRVEVLALEDKSKAGNNGVLTVVSPQAQSNPATDAVVQLNSAAPAPIQKMIKIHGVDAFTTHGSLPDAARLNTVLDQDSTVNVVKSETRFNVPLADIRKNFKPISKNTVDDVLKTITTSTKMQDSDDNTNAAGPIQATKRTNVKTDESRVANGAEQNNTANDDATHVSKRMRTNQPFIRPRHAENFSSENPQPKAPFATAQSSSTTHPSSQKQTTYTSSTISIEVDDSDEESTTQSAATTSTKPVPNRFNVTNDVTPLVGVPQDIDELETAQNDSKIQQQLPRNPNSKFSKQNKQQQKEWASKRGLYGGAVALGDMQLEDGDEMAVALDSSTNDRNPMQSDDKYAEHNEEDDDLYEEAELLSKINDIFKTSDRTLRNPIVCYVCKASFTQLHHFYDRLCPICASLNYKKRFQTAPMAIRRKNLLTGEDELIRRVCLVTGARVKIGYEIILKLLRAGAFVIGTSRFPIDTALRLSQEKDFQQWKNNIHIYGIDFRVLSGVELFVQHILNTYSRLDLIMNNAAQTIRRPPQFYRHLLNVEAQPIEMFDPEIQNIVKDYIEKEARQEATSFASQMLLTMGVNEKVVQTSLLTHQPAPTTATATATTATTATTTPTATTTLQRQTEQTDNPIPPTTVSEVLEETMIDDPTTTTPQPPTQSQNTKSNNILTLFAPTNDKTNPFSNSLAVHHSEQSNASRFVTMLSLPHSAAIPSSILTQVPLVAGDEDKVEDKQLFPVGTYDKDHQQLDLRPKQTWVLKADQVSTVEMTEVQIVNATTPFILNTKLKPLMAQSGDPCWIVNVSSMEGKFRGHKDITHPHTNMAKAALNMFTHTSSRDFAVDNIFMNAVDTGWVTEELPHGVAVHKAQIGFAPPLDEIDGAARCLDPIFTSLLTGVFEYGKFFKDYAEGHW